MPTPFLPYQRDPIAGGLTTPNSWYQFFSDLRQFIIDSGLDTGVIDSILARLDELEQNQIGSFVIQGLVSVDVFGTPQGGVVQVQLENDVQAPGNTYYYGTDSTGVKGWFTIASAFAEGVNIDFATAGTGVTTISMPAAGDGTPADKPIQYNADAADTLGSSTDLTFDPTLKFIKSGGGQQWPGKVFVTKVSELPAAIAGVRTLDNNTNYEISGLLDLLGDRIVCGTNCTLYGQTSDADGLTSTGLPGSAKFITSTSSLGIRNLRLSAPTGELFDLNDGATNSLNWTGVQIVDTPVMGTIQNYANIVMNEQLVQNSANLTLTGTIASFVSETSLWDGRTGQTTIIIPAAAVFTRRFRMLYTAVSVQPGETGIDFNVAATVPDESYILDNVSFTGSGTYLAGLTYTSNKTSFFRCFGITNTNAICQYSMTGNATATVIAATGTFVKVAGTTVASALNQKFNTATTNRALYTGAFPADFNVSVTASMRSGNNQNIRMRISKNGVTIAESNSSFITTGAGDASAVPAQTLTNLIPTDYIEVAVANDTAVNNITVSDLNLIIRRLG